MLAQVIEIYDYGVLYNVNFLIIKECIPLNMHVSLSISRFWGICAGQKDGIIPDLAMSLSGLKLV